MATSFLNEPSKRRRRRTIFDTAASALWRIPGRFEIASILGRSYALRCVVFHHVAETDSEFTRGMGVTITPARLERTLRFLATYYHPVSLQDVLGQSDGHALPSRSVLVTFDDGYASVMESAIPLCRRLGIPTVLFLNAAFLNNQRLAPDNLVCYVANTFGMALLNAAAQSVRGKDTPTLVTQADVFARFFPSISLFEREEFLKVLIRLGRINERQVAVAAGLYLTSEQVRELSASDVEIGNHTHSHVHCRNLSEGHFSVEIDRNKVELEAISSKPVRSFSVPYGSSADLSVELRDHLLGSGHDLIFLSQAVSNPSRPDQVCVDRVGPRAHSNDTLFAELELLPRLRKVRNWMSGRHTSPPVISCQLGLIR